jgi:hypothetical protein
VQRPPDELPVLRDDRLVDTERVTRARDLRRRGVLHVDEERGGTSVASRKPSPNWFNANTVRKIAADGITVSHGWLNAVVFGFGLRIEPHVCASRPPQLGVPSEMPALRNVAPTSSITFVATSSVPYAKSGGSTCGRRCVRMMRVSRAPTICAASTNSRWRSDRMCVRTSRAG